jgi:spermidine/putrescine transport system ATP-binding protein
MSDGRPALLELRGVDKVYDDVQVLDDINLSIDEQEFITVVGPSGSGKTTVLRLIGGFTEPSAGAILLDGEDITEAPINRRPFNTVFQDYALFPHLTAAENIAYGLRVRGRARAEIRDEVKKALSLVALEPFGERYPAQLSGGQRQRVALARAIICRPRLILLDEPLGALDAELRRQMQTFLKRLQKEIEIAFLFVTHDQEEAITMADRVCVMNHGEIVQTGSPQEVYYRPRSEYVARFFGDNNLLDGVLREDLHEDRGTSRRRIATEVGDLLCAVERQPEVTAAPAGARAKLAVRPEALRFDADAGRDAGEELATCDNRLQVRVSEINFTGPTSQIVVRPLARPELALTVKLPSQAAGIRVGPGSEAVIGWNAGDGRLVLD